MFHEKYLMKARFKSIHVLTLLNCYYNSLLNLYNHISYRVPVYMTNYVKQTIQQ